MDNKYLQGYKDLTMPLEEEKPEQELISKSRAKYLLRQVLEFVFEELDPFEFPDPKEWAINTFDIDEEEYKEIMEEL